MAEAHAGIDDGIDDVPAQAVEPPREFLVEPSLIQPESETELEPQLGSGREPRPVRPEPMEPARFAPVPHPKPDLNGLIGSVRTPETDGPENGSADQLSAPVAAETPTGTGHVETPPAPEVPVTAPEEPIRLEEEPQDIPTPLVEPVLEIPSEADIPIAEQAEVAQESLGDYSVPEADPILAVQTSPEVSETVFDEGTMEAFDSLVEILAGERGPDYGTGPAPSEDLAETAEAVVTITPEAGFETYLAAYRENLEEPESAPGLDEIIVQAPERPPEETLVGLAGVLEDDGSQGAGEDERLTEIRAVLKEIEELIRPPAATAETVEPDPYVVAVTPELTDKLLVLLRAVGYENPHEALLGLVSRQGFAFLAEAVIHLQRLSDSDGRLELSRSWLKSDPPETAASETASLATRLGRTMVAFIVAPDWLETLLAQPDY